ncbi:zinc-finger domain-containing protein [Paenibacillus sp. FSL H8-0317]|uniref:zinc-finger domain-containing protein n=1 Tax=Paenibacillus sp. FSL H8-0317 TaxID=2921385 RepID=UPI00324B3B77
MNRQQAAFEIGDILDNQCGSCQTRQELNKKYTNTFSKIDGHCNRECPVGKQLQELSKQLAVRPRKSVEFGWDK